MTGRPGLKFRLCRPLFLMYWHLTHTLSGKAHNVYTVRRVKVLCILNVPEDILGKDWVLYFWKSSEYCTPPNLNSLPIVPAWSFPLKCYFCSLSTWRTWAQLVILWEALSCHHFVLSQQWSDFHGKKRGFFKATHGLKQFCLCWLCVRHLSTDVCRDVLVSLLPFVFMVMLTCYMYWGPYRVELTRLEEPWVRHYLANTFWSPTECQGPWWTPGPQSMISNPDPEELTVLVA